MEKESSALDVNLLRVTNLLLQTSSLGRLMAFMACNWLGIRLLFHGRAVFFLREFVMNAHFSCWLPCSRTICITHAGMVLSLTASVQWQGFVLTLSVSAASESQNTIHPTKMQALFKQNVMIISRGWELIAKDFPTAGKVNKNAVYA